MKNPTGRKPTHGYSRRNSISAVYVAWCNMKRRCKETSGYRSSRYGGRGITVCERWLKFENFLADMGEPCRGIELDRIDNKLGYSKENCRWATRQQQTRNTESNRMIECDGESRCLSEWSEITGIKATTIWMRIFQYGWVPKVALARKAGF